MKKAIILYILLLVTVTGCIKENLDDCETTLYFSYLGDGTKEIFPQKIEKVDMYIYNQNNVFVQKTVLNRKELNRQRGTTLNLPSGQYHIICWGNSLNDTRINEGSSLQNNLVGAPHYFTKELISTNDSLYFGEREITIVNESLFQQCAYKNANRAGRTGCWQYTCSHFPRQYRNGEIKFNSGLHQNVFKRTRLLFPVGNF